MAPLRTTYSRLKSCGAAISFFVLLIRSFRCCSSSMQYSAICWNVLYSDMPYQFTIYQNAINIDKFLSSWDNTTRHVMIGFKSCLAFALGRPIKRRLNVGNTLLWLSDEHCQCGSTVYKRSCHWLIIQQQHVQLYYSSDASICQERLLSSAVVEKSWEGNNNFWYKSFGLMILTQGLLRSNIVSASYCRKM